MRKTWIKTFVVLQLAVWTVGMGQATPAATQLFGTTGLSIASGSGWLQIPPTDFARRERLVLTLGGTAAAVMVRLLPSGFDPNNSDIVVAERALVRTDRTVEVLLTSDFKDIVQVSVHGLSSPFNRFNLGVNNGPAALVKVERIRP